MLPSVLHKCVLVSIGSVLLTYYANGGFESLPLRACRVVTMVTFVYLAQSSTCDSASRE